MCCCCCCTLSSRAHINFCDKKYIYNTLKRRRTHSNQIANFRVLYTCEFWHKKKFSKWFNSNSNVLRWNFNSFFLFVSNCLVGSWFRNGHLLKYLNEYRKMISFYMLRLHWDNFLLLRGNMACATLCQSNVRLHGEMLSCTFNFARLISSMKIAWVSSPVWFRQPCAVWISQCTTDMKMHIIHGSPKRLCCYVCVY